MLQTTMTTTPAGTLQNDQGSDEGINIFALAGMLWRGKFTVLLCMIIALAYGIYNAYVVSVPQYASAATLSLKLQNSRVIDIESVVSGVSTDIASINTELEVIRSRMLIEELVEKLDLMSDLEFNSSLRPPQGLSLTSLKLMVSKWLSSSLDSERPTAPAAADGGGGRQEKIRNAVIARTRGAIDASNQRNTLIIRIRATTQSPAKSALLANTLADIYVQDQIDAKYQATENAINWLSERVVELEAELRRRENSLKQLRMETDFSGPEALEALNQRARDTRSRLDGLRTQKELDEARLERAAALVQAKDRNTLATELDDPILDRQIASVQSGTASEVLRFDARVQTLIQQMEANSLRTEQQIDALAKSLSDLGADIDKQARQALELEQLERDTEGTRTLYETFLTRLKETSVQRGLQQADSRILSIATPGTYVAPRKSRILLLSLMAGFTVGAALVMMQQMRHKGFHTAEEMEDAFGLPTLGQIPRMPIRRREELLPYLRDKSTSASAEAIRNLRTSILLSNLDHPQQVILMTSAVPGEGKTTQAVALAYNMSGLDKRVLLMDCDLRRRTLQNYFNTLDKTKGLVTALTTDTPIEEIIHRDPATGIEVLMGDIHSGNAADIFSSKQFGELITRLRGIYDHIILDTAPVLAVPDARIIGSHADAVLISVVWDQTNRDLVQEAIRQFRMVNVPVTGLIMARYDPKKMRKYGYDSYSSYGKGYYEN